MNKPLYRLSQTAGVALTLMLSSALLGQQQEAKLDAPATPYNSGGGQL